MAITQKYTANMMPKIQKMVEELVAEIINDDYTESQKENGPQK